ncbi:uncharacterized protein PFL1_02909 [Pseudozyma flocculosa PF-1]|uniref:Uncharacterized protein n=1 Tax=Pseudozyma flocculosa PF-1 TaxID=1277687 RepID=A0A061HB51_9BASI|nr:uncharacterized protein PFL1_02909 [Pseudozyma flocculosa PF-1]EPQ29689.1 hypothetical protein PFL1_02909 [Pseudozyma flocculosa PF-1]
MPIPILRIWGGLGEWDHMLADSFISYTMRRHPEGLTYVENTEAAQGPDDSGSAGAADSESSPAEPAVGGLEDQVPISTMTDDANMLCDPFREIGFKRRASGCPSSGHVHGPHGRGSAMLAMTLTLDPNRHRSTPSGRGSPADAASDDLSAPKKASQQAEAAAEHEAKEPPSAAVPIISALEAGGPATPAAKRKKTKKKRKGKATALEEPALDQAIASSLVGDGREPRSDLGISRSEAVADLADASTTSNLPAEVDVPLKHSQGDCTPRNNRLFDVASATSISTPTPRRVETMSQPPREPKSSKASRNQGKQRKKGSCKTATATVVELASTGSEAIAPTGSSNRPGHKLQRQAQLPLSSPARASSTSDTDDAELMASWDTDASFHTAKAPPSPGSTAAATVALSSEDAATLSESGLISIQAFEFTPYASPERQQPLNGAEREGSAPSVGAVELNEARSLPTGAFGGSSSAMLTPSDLPPTSDLPPSVCNSAGVQEHRLESSTELDLRLRRPSSRLSHSQQWSDVTADSSHPGKFGHSTSQATAQTPRTRDTSPEASAMVVRDGLCELRAKTIAPAAPAPGAAAVAPAGHGVAFDRTRQGEDPPASPVSTSCSDTPRGPRVMWPSAMSRNCMVTAQEEESQAPAASLDDPIRLETGCQRARPIDTLLGSYEEESDKLSRFRRTLEWAADIAQRVETPGRRQPSISAANTMIKSASIGAPQPSLVPARTSQPQHLHDVDQPTQPHDTDQPCFDNFRSIAAPCIPGYTAVPRPSSPGDSSDRQHRQQLPLLLPDFKGDWVHASGTLEDRLGGLEWLDLESPRLHDDGSDWEQREHGSPQMPAPGPRIQSKVANVAGETPPIYPSGLVLPSRCNERDVRGRTPVAVQHSPRREPGMATRRNLPSPRDAPTFSCPSWIGGHLRQTSAGPVFGSFRSELQMPADCSGSRHAPPTAALSHDGREADGSLSSSSSSGSSAACLNPDDHESDDGKRSHLMLCTQQAYEAATRSLEERCQDPASHSEASHQDNRVWLYGLESLGLDEKHAIDRFLYTPEGMAMPAPSWHNPVDEGILDGGAGGGVEESGLSYAEMNELDNMIALSYQRPRHPPAPHFARAVKDSTGRPFRGNFRAQGYGNGGPIPTVPRPPSRRSPPLAASRCSDSGSPPTFAPAMADSLEQLPVLEPSNELESPLLSSHSLAASFDNWTSAEPATPRLVWAEQGHPHAALFDCDEASQDSSRAIHAYAKDASCGNSTSPPFGAIASGCEPAPYEPWRNRREQPPGHAGRGAVMDSTRPSQADAIATWDEGLHRFAHFSQIEATLRAERDALYEISCERRRDDQLLSPALSASLASRLQEDGGLGDESAIGLNLRELREAEAKLLRGETDGLTQAHLIHILRVCPGVAAVAVLWS